MAEDRAAKKRATDDLNDIEALRKFPAFNRYHVRRVREEVEKQLTKLLEDDGLDVEGVYRQLLIYKDRIKSEKMMDQDEASCRSIIDSETQSD